MTDPLFYKQTTMPDLISGQHSPPIPASIGPYTIESLLNLGGMSLLYLGIHPEAKLPIAIKVLSPAYVNHPESVQRFLKEAQIIAMTNHPNIVKLYGQGEWEDGLYIAMEFIQGVSLRALITGQALSMRRTLEIILQVAYAILHLHSHGVIHRDLKPENILITEEGEIKVIDFGIAQLHEDKKTDRATEGNRLIGTPNYMSPEQKENPAQTSFASDIYSLGIILYELITGKLSYGMINLSLLPKNLKKIVSKALAVSTLERYQDIAALIHDISQYLNSKEIEKEKPGGDQIKEVYENLIRSTQNLSPALPPTWDQIDLKVAKLRSSSQLGLYYDFFRFPNNTYLAIIAASTNPEIDSAVHVGMLWGIVHTLLNENSAMGASYFKPETFLTALNVQLSGDLKEQFALSFIFLNPLSSQLTYFSSGMPPLIHIPEGGNTLRKLSSENPPLGSDLNQSFSQTTDNWNEEDIVILHSLCSTEEPSSMSPDHFELMLEDAIMDSRYLSTQAQADSILKRVASSQLKYPKVVIVIQRIT